MMDVRSPRFAAVVLLLCLLLSHTVFGVSAYRYRSLADKCVRNGDFAQAARYYRLEAAIYRRLGDPNAAKVEEMKAERWSTEVRIFADEQPDRGRLLSLYTGAKCEPVYGCYLGAFLDKDEQVNKLVRERGRRDLREDAFSDLVGKQLATSYMYRSYGVAFPTDWARALCAEGMIPHIAWEPNGGLARVQRDRYLAQFAEAAASCGGPVFIRFAGEMNGDWTAYHSNPALYKEKFRLIHDIMETVAPNVAMIWCVNHIPDHNISEYYPGDRYVDWVGVNFYSVIYHDNDISRPGFHECPTSFLKSVYRDYAGRKPIAICEYGASQMARLDMTHRPGFAIEKMSQLLSALPRLYPRVKLIDIFDCNNLQHAMPSRQLNNYCVTNDERVLTAFKGAIAGSYYLTRGYANSRQQQELPTHIRQLTDGSRLAGTVSLSVWVKTYDSSPTVVYFLDGKEFARTTAPGERRTVLDTSRLSKGKHILSVTVLDERGRIAGSRKVAVRL